MHSTRPFAVCTALLVAGVCVAAGPVGDRGLTPENFAEVQALIRPARGEDRWAQIPWRTSLWEARRTAAAEGKPILLWEMDGHPLGCT